MPENIQSLLKNKYGEVMEWYQNLPLTQEFRV